MYRRSFLKEITLFAGACLVPRIHYGMEEATIMTVAGPIKSSDLKFTLSHEHILVDFIGAEQVNKNRYDANEVYNAVLPYLLDVKKGGCNTFVDCTPGYLGRDVQILKRLSLASGMNIICPTGYYGAAKEKYVPKHAYTGTAEQLSDRWISEWKKGIEGTGIKPGFIKTGVDKGPLTSVQKKLIAAAALTHMATGLTIGVHTGDGEAAKEQLEILASKGVAPSARIWIHAQNEKDLQYHIVAAQRGSWVSFDGVSKDSAKDHISFLQTMKREQLLHAVLVSQDAGWYHVGEAGGGKFNPYNYILTDFIPALKENGFTQQDVDTIFIANPAKAFTVGVRTNRQK
jgi:predicted metal-dependent phosphotriesterase family hydrolase